MITNTIRAQYSGRSCTLNLTLRGLITYVFLWVINLQNFNHLTEREIQNNMMPISLKLVIMQEQKVTYWLNNLFDLFKGMPLIGIQTLHPSVLIVGIKWSVNSLIVSIALDEQ